MKNLAYKHHFGNTIPEALELDEGSAPTWLLSDYPQPCWKVTDTGAKTDCEIRFDVALPNGRRLSDYKNLYDGMRRVVYSVRTGPGATINTGRGQAQIAENFIALARWMIQNRIYRYDELTKVDMREYAEAAAFGVHNILQTEDTLRTHIEALWTGTGLMGDEPPEDRRVRAVKLFPVTWNKKVPVLDRTGMYEGAGLEGVGNSGRRSSLSAMLDELEVMCGFYQEPYVQQRRMARTLPEEDDEAKVTDEHLIRLIRPFQLLYRLRNYLDDAVHFLPFAGRSLRSIAHEMGGRAVGRTGTIPREIAMTLVERSARWVLDYAEPLLALKEWGDKAFDRSPETAFARLLDRIASHGDGPRGPGSPFPLVARGREASVGEAPDLLTETLALRKGMTLNTALAFLVIACVVIIATFSARRAAEVCGLEAGCISKLRGHSWLRVFIHKTLLQHTSIPVPELVVAAVKVLERLSERSRKCSGTKFLLQYNRPATEEFLGLNEAGKPVMQLALNLRRFGYFLDVPATEDGDRWVFRMHQFRRLFAIMYIRDYELGDVEALAHHLRHWNPEMTRRYCTEPEVGASIASARAARTLRILSQASLGTVTISGAPELVKELKDMRARMDQRVRVKSDAKFQKWLKEKVLDTGLVVNPFPWGFTVDVPRQEDVTCGADGPCIEPTDAFDGPASMQYLQSTLKAHRAWSEDPDAPPFLRAASAAFVHRFAGKFKKEGLEVPQ